MTHSTSPGDATVGYDPFAPDSKRDPEAQWRILRQREPVHHFVIPESELRRMSKNPLAAAPTTEFWTVLRHADAVQVLTNPPIFPSGEGPGPDRMLQSEDGGVMIFADGQVHLRQRRLTGRAFTPRSVQSLQPDIQRAVDDIIDGHAEHGTMELMTAGVRLSINTILRIMGIPTQRAEDFHRWGTAIDHTFGGDPAAVEAGGVALTELFGYVQTLIEAIRSGPTDADFDGSELDTGVLAAMVRAEYQGTRLSDEEIQQITMQLVVAGYETTSMAFANGVHALITNPEQRRKFEQADATGVASAVEEILRFVGPQAGLFRTTSADVEVGGCPLPKGAKVRVAFASANRDEGAFTDADQFRIDRDPAELRTHVAFGLGPHACIGAALARAELRIGLETLFRRLPGLELDPDRLAIRNDTMLTVNGFRELHIRWDPRSVQPARPQKGPPSTASPEADHRGRPDRRR